MGWKRDMEAALAVIAAIVGAGFASGREIASFFSGLGAASWLGVTAAGAGAGYLTALVASYARRAKADNLPEVYAFAGGEGWKKAMLALYGLLMAATGGAMLAASGELFALAIPSQAARAAGVACALIVGLALCARGARSLALLGCALAPVAAAFFLALACGARMEPTRFTVSGAVLCVPLGLLYAAFNVSVASGAVCLAAPRIASPRRAGLFTGALMTLLLGCANAALTGAGETYRSMALPTVALAARWGVAGFYLSAGVLWLAVLTTWIAVHSSLTRQLAACGVPKRFCALLAAACALPLGALSFERVVGAAYPLLGWLCAAALVALPLLRKRT